jgi:hypothetical protein
LSRYRWTDTDDRIILETVSESGPDRARIANVLGLPLGAVNSHIDRDLREKYSAATNHYYARVRAQNEIAPREDVRGKPRISDVLSLPVRPFHVEIPAPAISSKPKKWTTAVVYGDTHVPFEDPAAIRVLHGVIKDSRPDIIVNVGDVVDCWQISRFDKDPARIDSLQDNIDGARTHLHQVAQLAPNTRRVLLEGNHETRLARAICGLEGAAREFGKLRAFQEAMTWPNLLQTENMGWEFVPERLQSRTPILPKIITKHGGIVRKWAGWSGKGEWEKYGQSGVSGHSHRLGWFVHRDHNGNASWVETGCTCLLESPYGVDFDWQQGFAVMTWNQDHRLQNVEFVSVREGSAIWRDKEYAPKPRRAA